MPPPFSNACCRPSKHYINGNLKNFSENILCEQWETSKCETSCKKRIKSLENKIDRFQIENKRFVEESTNCMKIIELLSLGSKNKTTGKNNISKNLQIFFNQNVNIKCNIKKKIKST